MATTYQPNLAFDTLGFSEALIAMGHDPKLAKDLAVVTRDYVIGGMATNNFVHTVVQEAKTEIKQEINEVSQEITKAKHELEKAIVKLDSKIDTENEKIRHEITASENRMNKTNAKMLAFFTGIILAGIPIIQVVLAKLG